MPNTEHKMSCLCVCGHRYGSHTVAGNCPGSYERVLGVGAVHIPCDCRKFIPNHTCDCGKETTHLLK
jgi:hypothetical protein